MRPPGTAERGCSFEVRQCAHVTIHTHIAVAAVARVHGGQRVVRWWEGTKPSELQPARSVLETSTPDRT